MRIGPVGIWELVVILTVVLLVFGPAQLPKIARGVGNAVRGFRQAKDEITGELRDATRLQDPPKKNG